MRILPAGDSALLVSLAQVIDPAVNQWCVEFARAVTTALSASIRDVVIGYCTVTVYFDPLRTDGEWLERELAALCAVERRGKGEPGAVIDVPVAYGGELGPDLADVAAFGGCSIDEVIERHSSATYRVYLVGFVPGFAYMAQVDPAIAAPRRRTPRTTVPAGSVAIAGGQTGIYPAATPGGWNLIGRTPVMPFDLARPEPSLFHVGDSVRFRPIGLEEYARTERWSTREP